MSFHVNKNNPAGSTWKKWDLHIHSPCSIVQNYGGNTDAAWEAFLADLEKLPTEFKAIGINDYIFIDGYPPCQASCRLIDFT